MTNKEKEQALRLSELYKELAEKGTKFEYNRSKEGWGNHLTCPNLDSDLDKWRVAEKQDEIIDMSCLVGSDIDMEFGEGTYVAKLKSINPKVVSKYTSEKGNMYKECRVRQDTWLSWQGGECPLPEGLEVEVEYRNEGFQSKASTYHTTRWDWGHCGGEWDIISFKVLGVCEGWKYD